MQVKVKWSDLETAVEDARDMGDKTVVVEARTEFTEKESPVRVNIKIDLGDE